MIQIGKHNTLTILRIMANGAYLDDGNDGILLPKRYLPSDKMINDEVEVFIYHDNEGRLIATTDKPNAIVDEVAQLKVTDLNENGVFLDNGIMKDIFLHKTNMMGPARIGDMLWVYLYLDRDRITASEYLDDYIDNEDVQLSEKEEVQLMAYRKTEIGYVMVINKMHLGLLHFNEIFQNIQLGNVYNGFIKRIIYKDDHTKIDVALGKMGYERVEDESEKITRLLRENDNFLPYFDKSSPEEIYAFFGMSKKTFKMVIGKLYKERIIKLEEAGIRLLEGE
jgi:uncharacterized protein